MNHKVLLADDSLTIQKVIKITLANQPYDITDCTTEDDLFHKLQNLQPKLVFLDFNLSEKYTGYDLTAKIKSISPTSKVLLLLGTFDTVDDAAMEKSGASDKIVKPFDSNKFIAICKHLIDTFVDEELSYPEAKPVSPAKASPNTDDEWKVSHSTEQTFPQIQETLLDGSFPEIENPLLKEMSDWGMSVPGVINDHSFHDNWIDLPPVIEAKESPAKPDYSTKFPKTDDLDYPDLEVQAGAQKDESNLLSLDRLNDNTAEIQLDSYFPNESDVKVIEAQIKDEVEENLWHADEFEDLKKQVSARMDKARNDYGIPADEFEESIFTKPSDKEIDQWDQSFDFDHKTPDISASQPAISIEAFRGEMEEMVKKYVHEYMDKMFKSNVEKVSWEVIPDLAENLIRQELSKISHKIMDEQS